MKQPPIDKLEPVEIPIPGSFGSGPCVEFIVTRDESHVYAVDKNGPMVVTLVLDSDNPVNGKIVHRRLIKVNGVKRTVLLAELDGVKVYIRKDSIIVTKQKMQP